VTRGYGVIHQVHHVPDAREEGGRGRRQRDLLQRLSSILYSTVYNAHPVFRRKILEKKLCVVYCVHPYRKIW